MAKPPKSVTSPQLRARPEKRKPRHSQDENSTRAPLPKRAKFSDDKAASTSHHASLNPPPPTTNSRDAVPAASDAWRQEFRIERSSIITSSRIVQKVTRAVDALMGEAEPKPALLELHARGPATGKMITVVEIVKREVGRMGGEWFQYNKVEQVVIETEGPEAGNVKGQKGPEVEEETEEMDAEDGDGKDGETESFETMKTPFERANEGKAKVRAVPVMTIYLYRGRVEELRKAYGEQTNATEAPKG